MAQIEELLLWGRSSATEAVLEGLVSDGLLPPNSDPSRPVWIAPRAEERELKPPSSYIVSLVRLHERGFGVPAGRFVRALCDYYKVELHNFAPNAISQAAVFVAICEAIWGWRRTGTYGNICSAASSTPTPSRASRGGTPAPVALCSTYVGRGRTCTFPAR